MESFSNNTQLQLFMSTSIDNRNEMKNKYTSLSLQL